MTSDLVRREDAIKAIAETIATDDDTSAWLYVAEDMLKGVPSADRPQGEWIVSPNGCFTKCSECGTKASVTNFCPNCGARMRKQLDAKIVANGNCALCGKPLSDGRLFVCKECEDHIEEETDDE